MSQHELPFFEPVYNAYEADVSAITTININNKNATAERLLQMVINKSPTPIIIGQVHAFEYI